MGRGRTLGSAMDCGEERGMGDRLLRRREVERMTGLARSSIYRYMLEGAFPRPVRVGPAAVRWKASDITVSAGLKMTHV